MDKEIKTCAFQVKELAEEGLISGYASVFDVTDYDNDVIERGAFSKTLQERKDIPILWQHNPYEPIGITVSANEDTNGLFVTGRLNLDTQRGREALALLRQGVIKGLSIGFDVVKQAWEGNIRRLKEIRLWEWSLVTFPANPHAQVVTVKGVVPYQNLPLADMDRPWNGDIARANLIKFAGGPDKDKMDWDLFKKGFCWFDDENPEAFGSYKLPIADVIGGKLYAIPRGVFAAGAAVQGARGGVDVPESHIPGIKANLAKYYRRMGLTPPWEREESLYSVITVVKGIAQDILSRQVTEDLLLDHKLIKEAAELLLALASLKEPPKGTPGHGEPLEVMLSEAIQKARNVLEVL